MSITVGIDVSKIKIDVCIQKEDEAQQHLNFDNNQSGFKKLSLLLKNKEVTVCLEATGVYGENLCQFLYDMGVTVYQVNPTQIKYYAKSMMKRAKTDKVDAAIMLQFIKHHAIHLHPWKPRDEAYNKLKSLSRCRSDFKGEKQRIMGHIEACTSSDQAGRSDVLTFYKKHLKFISDQIQKIEQQLLEVIESCEALHKAYRNLQTIPGVGPITAIGLLAELPDIKNFNHVKTLVAYAGINPSIRQSGSSVQGQGRISKTGSPSLRNVLYMAALVGKNHCTIYKPLVDRLKEKGKRPKVIVIACMHKLLRIVYAILKKGVAFDTMS